MDTPLRTRAALRGEPLRLTLAANVLLLFTGATGVASVAAIGAAGSNSFSICFFLFVVRLASLGLI